MSKIKQAAPGSVESSPNVGRIRPVNMPFEENRLDHNSLARDLATAEKRDNRSMDCGFWA
ncbi:MAG: hypothetical protein LLG06_02010 [Desulfobacteraceae bacterium]|nr:hypothetical protein [Desulfobacteraceae bacterium]